MHGGDGGRDRRQVGLLDHPQRRALVKEGILGIAVGELDEGERGRPAADRAEREIDLAGMQRVADHGPEEIVGEAAEEAGRRAEAAKRDSDVEHRAADEGLEGVGAFGGLPRQEIDQRLAATDDHASPVPPKTGCHRLPRCRIAPDGAP